MAFVEIMMKLLLAISVFTIGPKYQRSDTRHPGRTVLVLLTSHAGFLTQASSCCAQSLSQLFPPQVLLVPLSLSEKGSHFCEEHLSFIYVCMPPSVL